ncbi:hypothetical protein Ahy_A05g023701 [Arachis hypogaea]|uniref:Uncharacterized protein n=1 Tax=Arachis hypogaea TaxID=3818 RepID=A0A445D4B7_ARAHY|nr:hypothetical protein Ahy_A05g023701 [Arachis hypogaea]
MVWTIEVEESLSCCIEELVRRFEDESFLKRRTMIRASNVRDMKNSSIRGRIFFEEEENDTCFKCSRYEEFKLGLMIMGFRRSIDIGLIRVLSSITDHHCRNRCHRRQSPSIILLLGPHFHPIHLRSTSLSSFVHLRFMSPRSSSHHFCSCYNTTPPPLVPPPFLHVDAQDRRCRFFFHLKVSYTPSRNRKRIELSIINIEKMKFASGSSRGLLYLGKKSITRGLAKIVPALAAGNSIVLKPPTQNSFTCGDTGIAISKKAMELGGKDACNVFEDADLDLGSLKLKDITVAMMN